MKHYVPLLTARLQIRQTFPVHQIPGTDNTRFCYRRREITGRRTVIMAFTAKYSIYPTVFVGSKTHIIYVCFCRINIRQCDRTLPEAKIINAIRTLCYSKKRFPVCTFHTDNQHIFTIPFNGPTIHGCVKTDTLHTVWISIRIKIIAPLQRYMFPRNYRICITTDNAIRFFHRKVQPLQQYFMLLL